MESIIKKWNNFTDADRWRFVSANDMFIVICDNDHNSVRFADDAVEEEFGHRLKSFDSFTGNTPGLMVMLESLGIQAEMT